MKLNGYDYLTLGFISVIIGLSLFSWGIYPLDIDIYYHLSVMTGFNLSGGVVTHDFWNFAPYGRPHLYPPFLHIIMLMMDKMGLSVPLIGKLVSFSLYPLSLITFWLTMKRIYGRVAGFYGTLLLSVSFPYFESQAVLNPSALVMVLIPTIFYCIERGKLKAGTILLTFSLYSHMLIGYLAPLSFLLYGLFNRERRRNILIMLVVSGLLHLPWIVHILFNLDYLRPRGIYTQIEIQIHLIPVVLALMGMGVCLKKGKSYYFPPLYLIALTPMIVGYPERFWENHGLMPLSMMGGIALALGHEKILSFSKTKLGGNSRFVGLGVLTIFLLTINLLYPILDILQDGNTGKLLKVKNIQTTSQVLISNVRMRSDLRNLMSPGNLKIADFVRKNIGEDEIFFINNSYLGGIITGLTGRAQAGGMYAAVLPLKAENGAANASLVIIVRDALGEAPLQAMLKSPDERANLPRRVIAKPLLPTWAAFSLVGIGLILIFIDFFSISRRLKGAF